MTLTQKAGALRTPHRFPSGSRKPKPTETNPGSFLENKTNKKSIKTYKPRDGTRLKIPNPKKGSFLLASQGGVLG